MQRLSTAEVGPLGCQHQEAGGWSSRLGNVHREIFFPVHGEAERAGELLGLTFYPARTAFYNVKVTQSCP